MGPLRLALDPKNRSVGAIEETSNQSRGILDVAPYATTGKADSFFDVFFEIIAGDQVLHPAKPVRMQSLISRIPPAAGESYGNPSTEPVELLDANNRPTGIRLIREVHTPNPPKEIDVFPVSLAQITLALPNGGTEDVTLTGPTTVEVAIPENGAASDLDGDGLDQVTTEMTNLDLRGTSSIGPVRVTLDGRRPTRGEIEEQSNATKGTLDVAPFTSTGKADSFFAVFFEIHVGERVLYSGKPIHMIAVITHKPPAPGDTYVNPFTEPVELLDANGNPTGIKLLREVHTPNPPKEIDVFPVSLAQITLALPNGGTENVTLSGPTTVVVNIPRTALPPTRMAMAAIRSPPRWLNWIARHKLDGPGSRDVGSQSSNAR